MKNNHEARWHQRFENFQSAFKQLESACLLEKYSDLEFAGLIKNFEITFEMAWKTLKDLLNYEGYDANSPRTTIQMAFESGIITDVSPWVDALESRNVLSHNYDKNSANTAVSIIKNIYSPMVRELLEKLQKRQDISR